MSIPALTETCSEGVRSAKRIVYWGAFIMPITYVSCLMVAFLKCIPFEKQWQIDPEPQSEFPQEYHRRCSLISRRLVLARHQLHSDHICHDHEYHHRLLSHGDSSPGMYTCFHEHGLAWPRPAGLTSLVLTYASQMVWKARMPWRKKFVILIMFSGGFLEMTFGILRAVSILTVSTQFATETILIPKTIWVRCQV